MLNKLVSPNKETNSEIMITDGSYHDVYDLRKETFTLTNIAIALGNTCRWGGHLGQSSTSRLIGKSDKTVLTSNFYSVAEHSVLGARYHLHREEKELAKLFLLHDAGEPFIGGDIPTPLKRQLPELATWEKEIQDIILDAYDLQPEGFKLIKETDVRICRNEVVTLFDDCQQWTKHIDPLWYEKGFDREMIKLELWSPQEAMNAWLQLATKLGLKNKYA